MRCELGDDILHYVVFERGRPVAFKGWLACAESRGFPIIGMNAYLRRLREWWRCFRHFGASLPFSRLPSGPASQPIGCDDEEVVGQRRGSPPSDGGCHSRLAARTFW